MCGFVGIFEPDGFNKETTIGLLEGMRDSLTHRGPNDSGIWMDDKQGIGLAHRRLSIIDLSSAGSQPMLSNSGRYIIAFNGEIYNHLQIRQELEINSKINWKGYSDTETLLEAFSVWDIEKTLTKAIGMFSFALWDCEKSRITLGRDRMGEKPLYYGWQGKSLLFGSELKSIKIHPHFKNEINKGVIPLYMNYGYIPNPYTIWNDIYKLTPGSYIQFSSLDKQQRPIEKSYWSLRNIAEGAQKNIFNGTEEDAINHLESLISTSIKDQLMGDVPIGAFLSGGIDSSTVVALMQKNLNQSVKTFTIGFTEDNYNEANYASKVAKYLGTDHHELMLSHRDCTDVIPSISSIYDEPFGDSSAIPTFLVSKMAKEHVTVALSGDAGDELFGGYDRYRKFIKWNKFVSKIPLEFRGMLNQLLKKVPIHNRLVNPRHLEILTNIITSKNYIELHDRLNSHWLESDNIVKNNPTANYWYNDTKLPQLNTPIDFAMYSDSLSYLADDILVKVDRAAMVNSLETRVPLLDHRIVDWSWSLPQSMKTRNSNEKWILKKVLFKHIPEQLFDRPKMGFGIPIGEWLKGPLKEWAEDLLDPKKMNDENLLNSVEIQKKWIEHKLGIFNWGYLLWDVLMFQSWLRNEKQINE